MVSTIGFDLAKNVFQVHGIDVHGIDENVVRAMLRDAGLKVGTPSRAAVDKRVRELCSVDAALLAMVEPLLTVLSTMIQQLA